MISVILNFVVNLKFPKKNKVFEKTEKKEDLKSIH